MIFPNGNRTQETRNGTLTPYVYNPAGSNWLAQIATDIRTKDAAGNTASTTALGTLGYDGYRRLIKSSIASRIFSADISGDLV